MMIEPTDFKAARRCGRLENNGGAGKLAEVGDSRGSRPESARPSNESSVVCADALVRSS
jgi:hypothetical protein